MRHVLAAALALGVFASSAAQAQDVSDIADSIDLSTWMLPNLLSGFCYMIGLIFGVMGILKLRETVDNSNQTPLRDPLSKFLAGGAMFALPAVYDAMATSIGWWTFTDIWNVLSTGMTSTLGTGMTTSGNKDINSIFIAIVTSFKTVPGLISLFSYLLGLVLGAAGILKLREHIENPTQTTIKEPVVRFLGGGALLSLPTVLTSMYETIAANDGSFSFTDILASQYNGASTNCSADGSGENIGGVICSLVSSTTALPALLTAFAYLAGLILGVWGILKIKDHVLNPQQVPLWDGLMRLLAGGGMFALPVVIKAAYHSLMGTGLAAHNVTNFNGTATGSGLDAMLLKFVDSFFGPMTIAMNFFGMLAGIILVMIAIMRLLKSSQEGPRGPGGIGTIMTFIAGGALLSFSPMISAFTMSFFDKSVTDVAATLAYSEGMDSAVQAHSQAVMSAILKFMIVLGLVSFARGIFIVRDVAEGNSQASMMAGLTHLIGGTLAINLGPLINAVQATLGLTSYGVNFS